MRSLLTRAALGAALLGAAAAASPAHAVPVVETFTDRTDFLAAVDVVESEDFDAISLGDKNEVLVSGALAFRAVSPDPSARDVFVTEGFGLPGRYIAPLAGADYIRIEVAPGFDALGLDVARLLDSGALPGSIDWQWTAFGEASAVLGSGGFTRGNAFGFFGLAVTGGELRTLDVFGIPTQSLTAFEALDDVALGRRIQPVSDAAAAIPLPAAAPLLAAGLGALAAVRRRRRG